VKTAAAPSPLAVSVDTAARMLDTHPSTVALWCRQGRLGAKIGRSWYIRVADIEALLRGAEGSQPAEAGR
jgi:hypothetical protein